MLPFDSLDVEGKRKLTALDVAQVAAVFVNGGKTIPEAVTMALELLDASQWGLQNVKPCGSPGGYDVGAKKWEAYQANRVLIDKHFASLPRVEWEPDGKGGFAPIPLDYALDLLFPRHKKDDRIPLFREWLALCNGCTSEEAGEEISRLREGGIGKNVFEWCTLTLEVWLAKRVSEKRRAAGKKGAQARKSKDPGKKDV